MQIYDERLSVVVDHQAPLLGLYDQMIHGEGPVWESMRQRLIFSDVAGRRLLAWYPDGRVEVVIDATPFINGNAVDAAGCVVHCEHLRRCVSRSRHDGLLEPFITHFDGKQLNTPNDITVSPDGSIWFTDPVFGLIMPSQGCLADPDLDHRSVYRHDPVTNELRRMADFEQPNGIHFSQDGLTLYVSDTSRAIGGTKHEIIAFKVAADRMLSDRHVFCQTDNGEPDGFLVDSRGWVWTTAGDGIHICDAKGIKLGFLPTPTTSSNCTLGYDDDCRLFITAEKNLFALNLR